MKTYYNFLWKNCFPEIKSIFLAHNGPMGRTSDKTIQCLPRSLCMVLRPHVKRHLVASSSFIKMP